MTIRITVLLSGIFLSATVARGQSAWPSPEVEQMYKQAQDYMTRGNLPQAIITYEQALQLAPEKMILYRDLGKAYYLSGNFSQAEKTLEPLIKSTEADPLSYQEMAAALVSSDEQKKAKGMLQKGIERFPASGILYHDIGKLYENENELVYALESWLDGIHHDPSYHVNYYEAARTYMTTNKPIWAILYGEMFINIERHTQRADETRKMLLDAYTKLYSDMPVAELPVFGKTKAKKEEHADNFEEAVRITYLHLSPVVADGITPETLTMLRTRFLMEWYDKYAAKYPFSLFRYQDDMLRNGVFDTYNQSIFGKVANAQEFNAWDKFHPGAITQEDTWASVHALHPEGTDFYNDKKVDDLFSKKKR